MLNSNIDTINIKATGNAIAKAVSVAEILKRRIPNLHQNLSLGSLEIKEE